MPEKKIRKTIRFNSSLLEKLSSFMESTRDPEVDKVAGKNTIAGSMTKALWFLFHSFFDKRKFSSRGLFDRSLFDLSENTEQMEKTGLRLNELVHAYNSGQPPRVKRLDILDELEALISDNKSSIDDFLTSYEAGEVS